MERGAVCDIEATQSQGTGFCFRSSYRFSIALLDPEIDKFSKHRTLLGNLQIKWKVFTVSLHYYDLKLGLNINEVGLKIDEREGCFSYFRDVHFCVPTM